jgi:hypothetical protein
MFVFFFFLVVLGYELGFMLAWQVLYSSVTPPALFCVGYFQDMVSQNICLCWLCTSKVVGFQA